MERRLSSTNPIVDKCLRFIEEDYYCTRNVVEIKKETTPDTTRWTISDADVIITIKERANSVYIKTKYISSDECIYMGGSPRLVLQIFESEFEKARQSLYPKI